MPIRQPCEWWSRVFVGDSARSDAYSELEPVPAGARLLAARRLVDAEEEEAQRRSQPPSSAAPGASGSFASASRSSRAASGV